MRARHTVTFLKTQDFIRGLGPLPLSYGVVGWAERERSPTIRRSLSRIVGLRKLSPTYFYAIALVLEEPGFRFATSGIPL